MLRYGFALSTVLALGGCSTTEAVTSSSSAIETDSLGVNALAQSFVDGEWATSMSIAVIDGDRVSTFGFGGANADTRFEVGSISKVFTATILAESDLALDDVVIARPDTITWRQLATHTSGLPAVPKDLSPASLADPYAGYTDAMLYAYLETATLDAPPGTAYAYSNLGFGLLGQLLAVRAFVPYADLVGRIARDRGMTATSTSGDVTPPHDIDGNDVLPWTFDALAGCGAVRSTVNDLVKFARSNLDAPNRALDLQSPPGLTKVGLGWHIGHIPLNDRWDDSMPDVRWHNGQTGGSHSFLALDLEKKKGVVVLSSTAQSRIDDLGDVILHRLRGEDASLTLPVTVTLPETTLESYVGTYNAAPGFDFVITREGTRLYAQATGQQRLRLFASAEGEFSLRQLEAQVSFAGNTLTLHQNGHDIPATRVTRREIFPPN